MSKSFIRKWDRLRMPTTLCRLETGFSMLEAVVVVGVLLALAVGGFFAYGPITENAKNAKVKSAASEVHTAVLVASIDGDPTTKPQDVIDKWNNSTDKIRVALVGSPTGDASGDFCVSATDVKDSRITAESGDCSDDSASSDPSAEVVAPTPTPTPTPTVITPPADSNAAGMTIIQSPSVSAASWGNRTAYSKTSQTSQFGFTLQEVTTVAQGANYKVEFTGTENIGLAATNTTLKPASGSSMFWYSNIAPATEGYKTGVGYVTATVTNLTDGSVSRKTWTLTITENSGIVQSSSLGATSWSDRTAYSKTSTASQFGFMINGAQSSDYTVIFSGGENIGMAATQSVSYVNSSWYSNTATAAEGYKTGTGTITATATHNGTGTIFTKSWSIVVTENPGIVQSSSLGATSWSDRTAYSKTSTPSQFGFKINGALASDYTVIFSGGENIGMAATQSVSYVSNSWYSNTATAAEGYKTGTGTITATATHKGTGTIFTKSWNIVVTENPGMVQSPSLSAASWSDRFVAVGSTSAQFGFMINGAQASDYTVVFSGGGNVGAAATQTKLYVNNSWYSNIAAVSGGFTAGTGTITATATHNGTGQVFTKTWTLTVN